MAQANINYKGNRPCRGTHLTGSVLETRWGHFLVALKNGEDIKDLIIRAKGMGETIKEAVTRIEDLEGNAEEDLKELKEQQDEIERLNDLPILHVVSQAQDSGAWPAVRTLLEEAKDKAGSLYGEHNREYHTLTALARA